ncbi:MAG: hypothetical protein DCC68_02015 [Planctomycetota bacterium]|nr:MAG: hypothetical protein DCC68_02015 [Planctomycetota bacterium]
MGRFFHNPSFNEYATLLGQLHVLMATGRGETDEAEDVRERMDAPWDQLDREESRLLRGLSSDLYSIGVARDRLIEKVEDVEFGLFTDAMSREDWPTALDIVRRNENKMHAAEVAFVRGVCWARLQQPRIALHFLDEAYRLGRRDVFQDVLSMTCEVEIGITDKAAARAVEVAQESQHPLVILRAATVLLDYALRTHDDLRARRVAGALTAFQKGLALANNGLVDPTERALLSVEILNAHIQLAIAYDALDELEHARNSCLAALDMDPTNEHALTLLGWLDRRLNANSRQAERPDAFRIKQHRSAIMDAGQILASITPQPSLG